MLMGASGPSRALGEALPALEAPESKKTWVGRDFGELVRECRRQRALSLPHAEKLLPAPLVTSHAPTAELPTDGQATSAESAAELSAVEAECVWPFVYWSLQQSAARYGAREGTT